VPHTAHAHRITERLADPVLRILASASLFNTVGRGIFLTLTILYFTLFVGLSAGQVAVVLTIASGVGILTSLVGGQLADRFSARRLLIGLVIVEGCGLIVFSWVPTFAAVAIIASVITGANRASNTVRSTMIARAFDGGDRAGARAILRTVTNAGIALGSAIGAIPLAIGTTAGYRATFVLAGCATIASIARLVRLPASVDQVRVPDAAEASVAGSGAAGSGGVGSIGASPVAARGRSPFRDPAYLALAALAGVFAMQFGVAEVALPIWVVKDTLAPHVLVSVALIINTFCVILFQIPISRGTEDVRRAGNAMGLAGLLMAAACFAYSGAAGVAEPIAIGMLLAAILLHTFAEVLSSAGGWSLSFELADRNRAGAYQGVYGMGFSIGSTLAPAVVTVTALAHGMAGWAILAVVFLASALGIRALARHQRTKRPMSAEISDGVSVQ
jgi:MFS family permease